MYTVQLMNSLKIAFSRALGLLLGKQSNVQELTSELFSEEIRDLSCLGNIGNLTSTLCATLCKSLSQFCSRHRFPSYFTPSYLLIPSPSLWLTCFFSSTLPTHSLSHTVLILTHRTGKSLGVFRGSGGRGTELFTVSVGVIWVRWCPLGASGLFEMLWAASADREQLKQSSQPHHRLCAWGGGRRGSSGKSCCSGSLERNMWQSVWARMWQIIP